MAVEFCPIDISRLFTFHHSIFKDCYLKYTQFRPLHRRFFTNEKLYKMGIKNTASCTFCKTEVDSVEHMLLRCPIIIELWEKVNNWLNETETKIILGDIENGNIPTTIILLRKRLFTMLLKNEGYRYSNTYKMRQKLFLSRKIRLLFKTQGSYIW